MGAYKKIQGNIRSTSMTENKEKVAPKVEQLRGSYFSCSGGKEHPSKSVKKEL
jgi:hypothetical protein